MSWDVPHLLTCKLEILMLLLYFRNGSPRRLAPFSPSVCLSPETKHLHKRVTWHFSGSQMQPPSHREPEQRHRAVHCWGTWVSLYPHSSTVSSNSFVIQCRFVLGNSPPLQLSIHFPNHPHSKHFWAGTIPWLVFIHTCSRSKSLSQCKDSTTQSLASHLAPIPTAHIPRTCSKGRPLLSSESKKKNQTTKQKLMKFQISNAAPLWYTVSSPALRSWFK